MSRDAWLIVMYVAGAAIVWLPTVLDWIEKHRG
jgi:hypothetical protein